MKATFDGFDFERAVPVCEPCHRVRGRTWTCRECGVVVCDHAADPGRTYVDGGCLCAFCGREHDSPAALVARCERLGLPRPRPEVAP